jgi:hypothetical protein
MDAEVFQGNGPLDQEVGGVNLGMSLKPASQVKMILP